MDEKSLSSELSQLFPPKDNPPVQEEASALPDSALVDTLEAVAGSSGGPLEAAVDQFLSGQGELHETTRAALARGGSASAVSELKKLLQNQFNLSPAMAQVIAPLLVKLLPSIVSAVGKETAGEKPKPKPKAKPKAKPKPKASAKPKKETASAKKKPKKETSSKPKKSTTKPAKKKTTPAGKKTAAEKTKPKKTRKES